MSKGYPPAGRGRGAGRGFGEGGGREEGGPEVEREDLSESNYDEFSGYGSSLFASDPYEKDDEEADKAYAAVDERMDTRRKTRREAKIMSELEKYRASRPKIQQQFSDLKQELAKVSAAEWNALPDIGDRSLKHKKRRPERYTPVPDSVVLAASRQEQQSQGAAAAAAAVLDRRTQGLATPGGTVTDLHQIGAARKTMLNLKLHQAADSVSGQTVVDPKGYLTDLNSVVVSTDAEIGDIQKARLLLKSVTTTNPRHAPGWIAAARLEEVAGRVSAARKLIKKGCQQCPENQDVWLEAARLHAPENAKAILAMAVRHIPHSVKVWLQAAALESDVQAKRRVLRKALECVPTSAKLWKAAVELEEPDDARVLLSRAVECVPHHVPMWLALAKLETYENARRVLNKARETVPTDARIWITAAKLEEANGNAAGVPAIVKRAVKSLSAHHVAIDREHWLQEAEHAERSGFPATCGAIVEETIGTGVEDEDRKATWMEDAESCLAHGAVQTARAIYTHALKAVPAFKKKKSLWLRLAYLEKHHGTPDALDALLAQAVRYCPQAEILWLMRAKEKWLAGDVDGARAVLTEAFAANPNSEQIWLAAVKLESANHEPDRARLLLAKARERAGTERVWLKSAKLETRDLRNHAAARELLDEALAKYPQSPKLWLLRGQVEEALGQPDDARRAYQRGLKNCPHHVPLWLAAAALEEQCAAGQTAGGAAAAGLGRARSILETARLQNPKTPELWLAAIETEQRAGNAKIVENLMAKALQDCPASGLLWAKAIAVEPRPRQKSRSVDALKRCDNDAHVLAAVAQIFWQDRKLDKARNWFNRAVALRPDLGDAWAAFYKFEKQHGTEEPQRQIMARCVAAEPTQGIVWRRVAKAPENAHKKTEQLLPLVAAAL